MDQITQLNKILDLCGRRALAAEARLRAALAEQRRAEEAYSVALKQIDLEIQNQKEARRKNISELLSAPVEQTKLSRIRLQYDVSAEKVTAARDKARQKAEEALEKTRESEQCRLEHHELEKRRQKITALIDKVKTPSYDPEPEPSSSRRFR